MKYPVGIVGFSGYSGAEAVRILSRHPHCEPVLLSHRADAGDGLEARPQVQPSAALQASPESVATEGLKAVLLATPPEVSMELAPQIPRTPAPPSSTSAAPSASAPQPNTTNLVQRATTPPRTCSPRPSMPCPNSIARRRAARSSSPTPAAIPPPRISPSARWSKPASSIATPASSATPRAASAAPAAKPRSRPASAKSRKTFRLIRS